MAETNSDDERVVLGNLDLFDAKHLKTVMQERGIEVELISDPAKCSTGKCKVTVDVVAASKDVAAIVAFVNEERSKLLSDLNINPDVHDKTFDTNQETATCPACGNMFSTKLTECPDCGLVFVPPEASSEA